MRLFEQAFAFQLDYFSKIDPYVPSGDIKINLIEKPRQYPRLSYKDAVELCAPFGICELKNFLKLKFLKLN